MREQGAERLRRIPTTTRIGVGLVLAAVLGACGAQVPSSQLVDARMAYQQASAGNAARYVPGNLLEARRALDMAEFAYRDNRPWDYQQYTAYVALRQAQIAAARGDAMAAQASYEQAQAARAAALEQQAADARAAQAKAEQELAQRNAELVARAERDTALSTRAEQAERERNEALATLRQLAAIQETERGLVITLAGSLLFRTDETTLLPVAQQRLDQVAIALRTLAGGQTLVIEGHTDSVGTTEYNQRLSGARAEAVRAYLVSRGVPVEQIVAVAKGEADPVAPNTTPEGRANNRRVEIVISRPSVPTSAQR